jgi:hypothetical protein
VCLLLGYSESTKGYKFLDLTTSGVVTAQSGNVRFHEEFSVDDIYMQHLLENAFLDGDHELPETAPVAHIKTSMETYLPDWDATASDREKQLEMQPLVSDNAMVDESRSSGSASSEELPATDERVAVQPGIAVPAAAETATAVVRQLRRPKQSGNESASLARKWLKKRSRLA